MPKILTIALLFIISIFLFLYGTACKKNAVVPFMPLISRTNTPTATDTPLYSPTNTPTSTTTFTCTPTYTITLNLSFTRTFTPSVTNTPQNGFGGPDADWAYDLTYSPDAGYLLAGQTRSFGAGGSDLYLVKTNQNGQYQWNRQFGGAKNDGAYSVIPCSTGGYLISGFTESAGSGTADAYALKIDDNGNFLWDRTVGGVDYDMAEAIIEAPDQSIYVAGSTRVTNYNFLLFKLDPSGNLLWQRSYGSGGMELCHSITTNYSGGYLLAGEANANGNYCLYDVDSSGNQNWTRNSSTLFSRIFSICKTNDGTGYIATGEVYVSGMNYNLMLVRLDAAGNQLWTKNFGGSMYDAGKSVVALSDGYIIAGETASFTPDSQFYIVRTDLDGNLIWQQNHGGSDFETAYSIINGTDNGFIFCGRTFSFGYGSPGDLYLMKINTSGAMAW